MKRKIHSMPIAAHINTSFAQTAMKENKKAIMIDTLGSLEKENELQRNKPAPGTNMIAGSNSHMHDIMRMLSRITVHTKVGDMVDVTYKRKNVKMKVTFINKTGDAINARANGKSFFCKKHDNKWIVNNEL